MEVGTRICRLASHCRNIPRTQPTDGNAFGNGTQRLMFQFQIDSPAVLKFDSNTQSTEKFCFQYEESWRDSMCCSLQCLDTLLVLLVGKQERNLHTEAPHHLRNRAFSTAVKNALTTMCAMSESQKQCCMTMPDKLLDREQM